MVRPTGIELVSSAPQADTLSIELWALKSDFSFADFLLPNYFNIFVFTFQSDFPRRICPTEIPALLYHFTASRRRIKLL